ncbi:Saccharopine dehydrogenase-domain-containing protein [Globomyces pollinis-pini]|nr:Saccharopine dehydrogenase-domain-containing protein [Globomyces pollinis-pini]
MLRLRRYSTAKLSIGIRQEAKNRWERRVPLVPDQVERLVKELGATVFIQPSTKRVIPDEKYTAVGAILENDLSKADIILGVKEVPIPDLIKGKTYMYFSHTHKGQHYNMPMLKSVLDKDIRLIDYELLKDKDGRRLVQFSKFAGYAGMIDGLHALGHRLLALGHGNPFLAIGMSYMYRCVADARLDVTRTGQVIMDDGLPKSLGPMIFVIVGDGNVSRGALHVFKCLPHQWVRPEELEALSKSKDFDNHKVYLCQVTAKDFIVDKNGNYDESDYFTKPEKYSSVFHKKIAPYARLILNGIFWTKQYPRLMTIEQSKQLAMEKKLNLLTLADVSCDINGSFEFMGQSSTIDDPFFMYDPIKNETHSNLEGNGIQIMSIDNLPTEMPLEASEFFSESLYPVVAEMVKGNFDHPVVKGATITNDSGKLESQHAHLETVIERTLASQDATVQGSRKILLLGSGFVAKPLVDYLLRNPGYSVTIASNMKEEALNLSQNRPRAPVVPLDVSNKESLGSLVSSHDIVVSFVPATMHPIVAEECLKYNKNLVTASYISPAMKALDNRAKAAGLTLMNEIGLDPGIDHLTACQMFDHVKSNNGIITSFVSWCGGLPAPEVSNNPLGYKFSWSPKGVLLAGLNSAKFKRDGKFIEIPGEQLLASAIDVPIFKGYSFEGLPNRDSNAYIDIYKLDNNHLETMFRGTLRYKGYSELMYMFSQLGCLSTTVNNQLKSGISWGDLMASMVGKNIHLGLTEKLGGNFNQNQIARLSSAISWLEMDAKDREVHPSESVLDAFCALLQEKLVYGKDERDMVAMHHEFGIKWDNGKTETRHSTMIAYGDPTSYSAMAKTVGYPAAIATQMILEGHIKEKGVIAPMSSAIYEPMIEKLDREGISFVESIEK